MKYMKLLYPWFNFYACLTLYEVASEKVVSRGVYKRFQRGANVLKQYMQTIETLATIDENNPGNIFRWASISSFFLYVRGARQVDAAFTRFCRGNGLSRNSEALGVFERAMLQLDPDNEAFTTAIRNSNIADLYLT